MRNIGAVVVTVLAPLLFTTPAGAKARAPFVAPFERVVDVASTVPSKGDVNPYGVAIVPRSVGKLVKDHVLASNFNDADNNQGTGATIVDIAPDGTQGLFAQISAAALPGPCPGGIGLTTALVVLRRGFVVVGSLPTANGMTATAQAGCLLVLDAAGTVVETISGGPINGPWDMTAADFGSKALLFVTNVLNGPVATSASSTVIDEGTIVRIALDLAGSVPSVGDETAIGSGFGERSDPTAGHLVPG